MRRYLRAVVTSVFMIVSLGEARAACPEGDKAHWLVISPEGGPAGNVFCSSLPSDTKGAKNFNDHPACQDVCEAEGDVKALAPTPGYNLEFCAGATDMEDADLIAAPQILINPDHGAGLVGVVVSWPFRRTRSRPALCLMVRSTLLPPVLRHDLDLSGSEEPQSDQHPQYPLRRRKLKVVSWRWRQCLNIAFRFANVLACRMIVKVLCALCI